MLLVYFETFRLNNVEITVQSATNYENNLNLKSFTIKQI